MGDFVDRVVVVTGGASGIGLATVRRFVGDGAKAVIVDLDGERAAAVARELPGVEPVVGDVRDADVRDRAARVASELGDSVGFLVNCAASFRSKAEDATDADWEISLGVNVRGTAMMAAAIVPLMRRAGGGAIVNVASISRYIAQPHRWTYNATKGAILSLTRCQALDLAKDHIRVNSVSPGTIWTPELDRMASGDRAAWEPVFAPHHMLNRVGEPEEVAAAILFLCGPEASFITGTDLKVDGGYTAMGHDAEGAGIKYTR